MTITVADDGAGCHTVASDADPHGMTSVLDELRRMFEADRTGSLHVYFLVIEGLTETVSSCPKYYQPQTLDVLFALLRSASGVPGNTCKH